MSECEHDWLCVSAYENPAYWCTLCGSLKRDDEIDMPARLALALSVVDSARAFCETHTMLGGAFDKMLLELERFDAAQSEASR